MSQTKLNKIQTEKVEREWDLQKPLLLHCVERQFGELSGAFFKLEQEVSRETQKGNQLSTKQIREKMEFGKMIIVDEFLKRNGYFTNRNKHTQNSELLRRASKTVKLKFASLRNVHKNKGFDISTAPLDGHDFEYWVASNLKIFGWDVTVTVGSGDQGIDVLASFDKKTLAIQCKRFKGSVGNRAVQEAYAGGIYYKADCSAVITTSSYTRSAVSLAKSTGVLLCQVSSIPALAELFTGQERKDTFKLSK